MKTAETNDRWISKSKKENKTLFSEVDLLLRALDRFFNLEDFPASNGHLGARNFLSELQVGQEGIVRVLNILERIIPADKKNAYLFHKFTETKFLTHNRRNTLRREMYTQDTPEKSLYVLYGSFLNLKSIVSDLRRNEYIDYMGFRNLGQVISKEIRENAFFNPFKREVDPDLDYIRHSDITSIVKGIKDKDIKKTVSVSFLYLFRFMRYIDHVDVSELKLSHLHPALLIITLLNSEADILRTYLRKTVKHIKDKKLANMLESMAYQFAMETRRVYDQELRDIFDFKDLRQLRGRIENSHGIMKNLIEHTIINMAQHWRPGLRGEDIFIDYVTKTEQSTELRENIYVLSKMLIEFEKSAGNPAERPRMLKCLKVYMEFFEKKTFMLLRHDDYSEFQSFFAETMAHEITDEDSFRKFLTRCQYFIVFLDTTLRHIDNRAELIGRPLDTARAEEILSQFISSQK